MGTREHPSQLGENLESPLGNFLVDSPVFPGEKIECLLQNLSFPGWIWILQMSPGPSSILFCQIPILATASFSSYGNPTVQ